MEYVKLNNGVMMPLEGFGVFQIPDRDEVQDPPVTAGMKEGGGRKAAKGFVVGASTADGPVRTLFDELPDTLELDRTEESAIMKKLALSLILVILVTFLSGVAQAQSKAPVAYFSVPETDRAENMTREEDNSTVRTIAGLQSDAKVSENGLSLHRDEVQDSERAVVAWLRELEYAK